MEDFILNWNQKKILRNLSFLKKYGFYLAGGTALALQFGHRTSKDLDFYTKKNFNPVKIVKEFRKVFKKDLKGPRSAEDTLWLKIKDTDLSFFRYPYLLIRPLVSYETVKLTSAEDIIAMKIEAIITRGKKRDFVDMYFAMRRYGIKKVLGFFKEKYPEVFNEYNCVTALTYFEDAEKKEQGRKRVYIYSGVTWPAIKKYITEEVKKYQLSLIKK
ncbi:MAG: hypothetical protein COU42_01955 [Candidatus Nealsonbacteria bacterium CG10_big_fil_rev_8_21_14_0_10_36_24]|uniref:Nucleotidyl transferase AbiEii/AbiGii toxin family protein n=2 Tax=Candidatus Nealsoniibacteriota TaxID=1817911 RepID=A0A2H0YNY7_9BACT|nr:MAG: hypothetical protein COU42_01955 [Candidatus Nealsonbacteria bacterium CG10_big_fil_rev_8_21_14_0_10_36_24]PIS40214.1 MAG: hypothetical protein COT32_01015 [Candidatus Nealsonbacteria bacterium CG08_land_8_20_14_0_20_36_22]